MSKVTVLNQPGVHAWYFKNRSLLVPTDDVIK